MAEEIPSPHDALVRSILSRKTSAISFLHEQLPPALTARIDWESLERLSGSFITEEMRSLHSDFIFAVRLDDQPLLLYCLLEHQSRVHPFMRFRLLGYLVNILSQWLRDHAGAKTMPPVIPMVLHTGGKRWNVSCRMSDLFEVPGDLREAVAPLLPDFTHLLLDLSQVEMGEIGGEIVVRTMLTLLKAAAAGKIEHWLDEHGHFLVEMIEQEDARGVVNHFLRYICRAGSGTSYSTVQEKLSKLESPQINEHMMTIADELMEKGIEKGIEKGRIIGRIQLLEELLGRGVSDRKRLAARSRSELQTIESQLRVQLAEK